MCERGLLLRAIEASTPTLNAGGILSRVYLRPIEIGHTGAVSQTFRAMCTGRY